MGGFVKRALIIKIDEYPVAPLGCVNEASAWVKF